MGSFPASGVCACCNALRCPGRCLNGSGHLGSLGPLGTGVNVFGFCSLLPTLEFSVGQKANGRLLLVPGVGGGEVSVKKPKPRREEGW